MEIKKILPSRIVNKEYPFVVICSLCKMVITDPILCENCDSCYCTSCISNYSKEHNGACATCDVFAKREAKTNSPIIKVLSQLTIACSSKGCVKQIPYLELAEHEFTCEFHTENCGNPGCKESFHLKEMPQHLLACEFAKVKCEFCNQENILRKDLKLHISNCEVFPIECNACKSKIIKKEFEDHILKCPEILIPCKRCEASVPRKLIENHDCIKFLKEEIKQLKGELEKEPNKLVILSSPFKMGKKTFNIPNEIPNTAKKILMLVKVIGTGKENLVRIYTKYKEDLIADIQIIANSISSMWCYTTGVGQTIKMLITPQRIIYIDGDIEEISIFGYK